MKSVGNICRNLRTCSTNKNINKLPSISRTQQIGRQPRSFSRTNATQGSPRAPTKALQPAAFRFQSSQRHNKNNCIAIFGSRSICSPLKMTHPKHTARALFQTAHPTNLLPRRACLKSVVELPLLRHNIHMMSKHQYTIRQQILCPITAPSPTHTSHPCMYLETPVVCLSPFVRTLSAAKENSALEIYNTANFFQASQQYNLSQEYYQRAIALLEETPNVALGHCYYQLGKVLQAQQALNLATHALNKALEIFQTQNTLQDVVDCHLTAGQLFWDEKLVEKAVGHFQAGIAILKEIPNPTRENMSQLAEFSYSLGRCFTISKDWTQALRMFQEALELFKQTNDTKGVANCYYYLAVNLMESDLKAAFDNFKQALVLRRDIYGNHHSLVADCYRKLGNVTSKLHDFDAALDYYYLAVNIEKVLIETDKKNADTYKSRKAICYYKMGLSKDLKGDNANAEHYYLKALRAFPTSHEQRRYPQVLLKLSEFYKARGHTHEADEFFGRAVDWYLNHKDHESAQALLAKRNHPNPFEIEDDFELPFVSSPKN